jgi:hypothetical protein
MFPGDKPGHEVTMRSRLDTVTISDPAFAGGQAAVVIVSDHVAGTGTDRSWRVTTYPSGDKIFSWQHLRRQRFPAPRWGA